MHLQEQKKAGNQMADYIAARENWRLHDPKTPEELDLLLYSFRILFAYHSGKIENDQITYHDTREIFENGKALNFTGDPRALFEQQNQKLCYDFLRQKIVDKEPLSVELIKEVHAILTSGTFDERRYVDKGERPGEFKKHDYVTGIHEVGYAPEEVEDAISELVDELAEIRDNANILKAAAYFHARFEYIHPFADGNGRVGRTLLNYFLMIHGEPPVIVYDEDKKEYYKALEQYDEHEEIDALADFLQVQTIKTWEKTLDRSQGKVKHPRKKLSEFER